VSPGFSVAVTCLLIVLARIADVTFGTLRTVSLLQRRRFASWALAFLEVLAWIFAAANVLQHLTRPIYGVSYALGYATGTWVGLAIEDRIAYGRQILRLFTRRPNEVVAALRSSGRRPVAFQGEDDGGPITMLVLEAPRRDTAALATLARDCDPCCRYIVGDVRLATEEPARGVAAGA
jgi:uncharacterized protein YebE (UPF0316 family)